MDNNYELSMDGVKAIHGAGAIRYEKDKGRFDLLEGDVITRLIARIEKTNNSLDELHTLSLAFYGDYIGAIIHLTFLHYGFDPDKKTETFVKMLEDVAIHYQKGAKKYGARNCEHGISLWSFRDSGIRHMCQYIRGRDDEPHHISAIWNFMMADWTINNHPEWCNDDETIGEEHSDHKEGAESHVRENIKTGRTATYSSTIGGVG